MAGVTGLVFANYAYKNNASANDTNITAESDTNLETELVPEGKAEEYASLIGNEQAIKDEAVDLAKEWLSEYELNDESLQKIEVASLKDFADKDGEETTVIGATLRISYAGYEFATAVVDFTDEEQVFKVNETFNK